MDISKPIHKGTGLGAMHIRGLLIALAALCAAGQAQADCSATPSLASKQVQPQSKASDTSAVSFSTGGGVTALALKIGGNAAPVFADPCITHSLKLATSNQGSRRATLAKSDGSSDPLTLDYAWHFKQVRGTKGLDTNVTLGIGQQDFNYHDPQTLTKARQRTTLWRAGVGTAYSFESNRGSVGANYTVGRSHESSASGTRCPLPVPGSAAPVVCVTGAIGAPTKLRQRELQLGAGYFINPDHGLKIELSASYDFNSRLKTLSLPLSVMTKPAKGADPSVRGGLSLGWDSQSRETRWSLFVASPFSLL